MSTISIGRTNDSWQLAILKHWPEPLAASGLFLNLATLGGLLLYQRVRGQQRLLLPTLSAQILLTLPGRLFGYRVIWLINNQTIPKILKSLVKLLARPTKYIVAPNQAAEVEYLKIGIPSEKIKTIYPPCRRPEKIIFPYIEPFTLSCDSIVEIANGLGTLLRALGLARDILGNIKLIIAGPIHNRAQIEWSAKTLGLGGSLQFSPGNSDLWLAECHAYILPTADQTIVPISLLQAMALGRAIITTDKLEHKEFVEHEKRALLVSSGQAEELSQAIIRLARDAQLLASLGEENYRFASEHFSSDAFVEKIRGLLS
ncbi:MAG: glycosyltransferase family 4 protein [Candidatus Komeilibacteria bacterium]|nr:glycosyltransferase family 4 protein [Candidatus Komeilibacteria bacterium]